MVRAKYRNLKKSKTDLVNLVRRLVTLSSVGLVIAASRVLVNLHAKRLESLFILRTLCHKIVQISRKSCKTINNLF